MYTNPCELEAQVLDALALWLCPQKVKAPNICENLVLLRGSQSEERWEKGPKTACSDKVWTEGLDWGTGEDKEKNAINTKLQ